jgi:hypothetical protein
MSGRDSEPSVGYDLASGGSWLTIHAAREGLTHARHAGFPCRAWTVGELCQAGFVLLRSDGAVGLRGGCELLLRRGDDVLVELIGSTGGGVLRLHAASTSPRAADEVCTWFDQTLREERLPREETRVPIHFWTMSTHGPRPMRMMIEAPTWAEIADNYAPGVRGELDRSMRASRSQIEGVALWRGEPGTGKTTALRALAMEWANWCDVHVIVDPEVFLGDQASYLMDVLFSFQDPHTAHLDAMMAHDLADGMSNHGEMLADDAFHERQRLQSLSSRAKLIVLEDAGELVTTSARAAAGQALSRLLNVSDGMLGQGANISVLVTTNEQLDDLHPAIQRPGRSWAHVEFDELDVDASRVWLAEHGVDHEPTGPMSLAQLYALQRGDRIIRLDDISRGATDR